MSSEGNGLKSQHVKLVGSQDHKITYIFLMYALRFLSYRQECLEIIVLAGFWWWALFPRDVPQISSFPPVRKYEWGHINCNPSYFLNLLLPLASPPPAPHPSALAFSNASQPSAWVSSSLVSWGLPAPLLPFSPWEHCSVSLHSESCKAFKMSKWKCMEPHWALCRNGEDACLSPVLSCTSSSSKTVLVGGQAWPLRGLSASAWNVLGRHQLLCTSFTLLGLPLPSHRQSSVCFITHTWAPQNPLYWDSPRNYTSWGAADRQEQERKLRSFCSFRPSFSIYQALATCQILCWGSGGTEVKNLAFFDKPLNWVRLPKMMALRDEGREEWSQTSLSCFAGLSEGIADSW